MLLLASCTQETQNKFGRAVQNWTGTDGVLEVYSGEKLVKRFIKIDKLSTAIGTQDDFPRAYRFGYGVLDANLNGLKDPGEKKVYFEIQRLLHSLYLLRKPHITHSFPPSGLLKILRGLLLPGAYRNARWNMRG